MIWRVRKTWITPYTLRINKELDVPVYGGAASEATKLLRGISFTTSLSLFPIMQQNDFNLCKCIPFEWKEMRQSQRGQFSTGSSRITSSGKMTMLM